MASQEQIGSSSNSENQESHTEWRLDPIRPVQNQEQLQGSQDLLDEIDAVLESNAEEFVKGFVQKGGE